MKILFAVLGFFMAFTVDVSISHGTEAKNESSPQAIDTQKAATAFRLFLACASKIDDAAPFDRCLKSTMEKGSSRFDEMKATEFLNLGLKIPSIGKCPKSIEPEHTQRRLDTKLSPEQTLQFACFFSPIEKSERGASGGVSGEVEFSASKNGELKVRRVRYSF